MEHRAFCGGGVGLCKKDMWISGVSAKKVTFLIGFGAFVTGLLLCWSTRHTRAEGDDDKGKNGVGTLVITCIATSTG